MMVYLPNGGVHTGVAVGKQNITALQNTVEMAIIHTYMIQVIMYGQSGKIRLKL